MPEYGWSRMFVNMLGFLLCLNKNKYGWISLKYARICLKCKVKDTIKLLLKLDSIYKRERDTCRTVSNAQNGAFVKMLHMVLWIYFELCDRNMPGFWICQVLNNLPAVVKSSNSLFEFKNKIKNIGDIDCGCLICRDT